MKRKSKGNKRKSKANKRKSIKRRSRLKRKSRSKVDGGGKEDWYKIFEKKNFDSISLDIKYTANDYVKTVSNTKLRTPYPKYYYDALFIEKDRFGIYPKNIISIAIHNIPVIPDVPDVEKKPVKSMISLSLPLTTSSYPKTLLTFKTDKSTYVIDSSKIMEYDYFKALLSGSYSIKDLTKPIYVDEDLIEVLQCLDTNEFDKNSSIKLLFYFEKYNLISMQKIITEYIVSNFIVVDTHFTSSIFFIYYNNNTVYFKFILDLAYQFADILDLDLDFDDKHRKKTLNNILSVPEISIVEDELIENLLSLPAFAYFDKNKNNMIDLITKTICIKIVNYINENKKFNGTVESLIELKRSIRKYEIRYPKSFRYHDNFSINIITKDNTKNSVERFNLFCYNKDYKKVNYDFPDFILCRDRVILSYASNEILYTKIQSISLSMKTP
jgi:hypothetical protein